MTTYTVTARTPEHETIFLDVTEAGWLVMTRTPVYLHHGPQIKDVVWAAVCDRHLTDVTVNQIEGSE